MKKAIVILLLLLHWCILHGQTTQVKDGVQLVDYHFTAVTDVVYAPAFNEYFSSDQSGKIISYDGTTQKYKYTFQNADGVGIKKMQLINKNRLLLHKSYASMDGKTPDSLVGIDIATRLNAVSNPFTGGLLGNDMESYVAYSVSKGYDNALVIGTRSPFKVLKTLPTSKAPISASVSSNGERVALVQAQFGKLEFVVKNMDNETIYEESFKESDLDVDTQVVYEPAGSILLIVGSKLSRKLTVYRYTVNYKREVVTELSDIDGLGLFIETISRNNTKELLIGYGIESYSNKLLLGILKSGTYQFEQPDYKSIFSYGYLPQGKSGFITVNSTGIGEDGKAIGRLWNKNKKQPSSIDNTAAFANFTGQFISNGDLLFVGKTMTKAGYKEDIKCFTAGTLQNKFAPLGFVEHVKRYEDLEIYNLRVTDRQLDIKNSSMAIMGYYKGEKRIVSYDFGSEEIKILSPEDPVFNTIVDYHGKSEQVILKKTNYGNYDSFKDYSLQVCNKGDCKMLKGNYKDASFSRDGDYLLSLNYKNLLQLRKVKDLSIVIEKQLDENVKATFFAVEDFAFEIALNLGFKMDGCFLKNLSLELVDGTFKFTERDCIGIAAVDYENETPAIVLKYGGLILGDAFLDIDKSTVPTAVSFNNDGSKLLLSYKHGLVELYDVATGVKQLSIVQPDYDSHLFIDNDGNYFTNFDAGDLVSCYENGTAQSLNAIKNKYYKPSSILEKLGNVDADYAQVLSKAEDIRDTFTSSNGGELNVVIENFKLLNSSSLQTSQLINDFSFKANQSLKNDVTISINGVGVNDVTLKSSKDYNYSFNLELAAVENVIEIKSERGTLLDQIKVNYTGTDLKPDLYVLAVGVSNYEQSKYNLTFAAKDAMDMAQFYGNLGEEEILKYENEYYSKALFLTDKEGNPLGKEIKLYLNGFDPLRAQAVSSDGYYWISSQKLFDFKTGTVIDLDSNDFEEESYAALGDLYIVAPDNTGFYYQKEENVKFYDFKSGRIEMAHLPFENNSLFNYDPVHLLSNDLWLQSDSGSFAREDSYGGKLTLTYSKKDNVVKTQTIEVVDQYNLSLEAVSVDGDFVLIKDINDTYYFYNVSTDQPKLISKSNIENTETTDEFYIIDNGSSNIRFKDGYPESERVTQINYFNKNLELTETKNLDIAVDLGIINVAINGSGVQLLKRRTSKATSRGFMGDKIVNDIAEDRSATAASFNNTNVSYLLDEEANKKNILKELKALKDKVRPQDQIVVFIAGHGVLDKDLNYYYAPNDMDFENVKENGVSFDQLIQGLNDTRSTKMLLLMDTCHSGNTLDMENYEIVEESIEDEDGQKKRGGVAATTSNKSNTPTVSQVVSTLFDNFTSVSGVTVLSASSGVDVAYESEELSNGAFTTAYITRLQEQLGKSYSNDADFSKPVNLSDDFIKNLRDLILDYTNNKQQLDIREINELSGIRLW